MIDLPSIGFSFCILFMKRKCKNIYIFCKTYTIPLIRHGVSNTRCGTFVCQSFGFCLFIRDSYAAPCYHSRAVSDLAGSQSTSITSLQIYVDTKLCIKPGHTYTSISSITLLFQPQSKTTSTKIRDRIGWTWM